MLAATASRRRQASRSSSPSPRSPTSRIFGSGFRPSGWRCSWCSTRLNDSAEILLAPILLDDGRIRHATRHACIGAPARTTPGLVDRRPRPPSRTTPRPPRRTRRRQRGPRSNPDRSSSCAATSTSSTRRSRRCCTNVSATGPEASSWPNSSPTPASTSSTAGPVRSSSPETTVPKPDRRSRSSAREPTRRPRSSSFPKGDSSDPTDEIGLSHRLTERDPDRARRLEGITHVIPPRPGGVLALLDAIPDADVVVIAHRGLDHYPTFRELARAVPLRDPVRVTAWRVPAADIPTGDDKRTAWLDDQWCRVDAWVGARHRSP